MSHLPDLDHPDDDPYLWLEEIEGDRAVEWVDAESAKTLAAFSGTGFEADRAALLAIMDSPEKLPYVSRRGDHLYTYWIDAAQPIGLWRRTTLASFRSGTPEWQTVLDLDALAEAEGEDWIWAGPSTLPGTHDIAMIALSVGGGDATVLREFDMESRTFIPDGFTLPEAKTQASWYDRDTLIVASALGEGMATGSGYARTVRVWRRGTDFAQAKIVFEVPEDHLACGMEIIPTESGKPLVLYGDVIDFFHTDDHLGTVDGPVTPLDLPSDATKRMTETALAIKPRTDWTVEGTTHPSDAVLVIDYARFAAGERDFQCVFTPGERLSISHFYWLRDDALMVCALDDMRPVHTIWRRDGDRWTPEKVAGLPEIGTAYVWPFDTDREESDGTLLANIEDPLTPASLLHLQPDEQAAPTLLRRAPVHFDTRGLVVSRHEAISTDGERIPYIQVGPQGASGDAPVHLTGYGGFGVPMLPGYNAGIGKTWLERGGVSVTANIRGGGEFGTRWHEAGRLAGKRLSHDDFAAVAADLVERGITVPGRIAAEGGSNGGHLIANMLTRYPDRFGALFCTIPLIDMRRYTKLLAGASWMAEYGDPDKPEDWEYLSQMSAYHTARSDADYPPILIATARKDDRVHPGHARKMVAKLKAMGHGAWLYEPPAGGHGYGKDNAERATFTALGYAFLRDRIGWT